MSESVACESDGCGEPAWADARWATAALGQQVGSFCRGHLDQLWAMLNPLTQLGRCDFSIGRPGEFAHPAGRRSTPEETDSRGAT